MQSLERIRERISIQELAEALGAEIDPGSTLELRGVAPMHEAGPDDLTFLANPRYARFVAECKAGAILVSPKQDGPFPMPTLRVANPYLAFAEALDLYFRRPATKPGIHPTAVIADSATLGADVHIGPYVVIGENVTVGAGSVIHAHCVLYDDCTIGEGALIHSHTVIREGTSLGTHAILQNHTVVGSDGFGFAPRSDGSWRRITQTGHVTIGDDVEIQAGTCIDRAAIGVTRIGRGTKIDNLVQVGHGCQVGEDTLLCGQVGLAGSTTVGDRVKIGGQAGTAGHLQIHDDISVAGQAGVAGDLEEKGEYAGAPCLPMRETRRHFLSLWQLPTWFKRIKALEKSVAELQPIEQDTPSTD
jgi:UDP-3-O-[3-hydroxymyristoyl] glucosamine N-acyltransferase